MGFFQMEWIVRAFNDSDMWVLYGILNSTYNIRARDLDLFGFVDQSVYSQNICFSFGFYPLYVPIMSCYFEVPV